MGYCGVLSRTSNISQIELLNQAGKDLLYSNLSKSLKLKMNSKLKMIKVHTNKGKVISNEGNFSFENNQAILLPTSNCKIFGLLLVVLIVLISLAIHGLIWFKCKFYEIKRVKNKRLFQNDTRCTARFLQNEQIRTNSIQKETKELFGNFSLDLQENNEDVYTPL